MAQEAASEVADAAKQGQSVASPQIDAGSADPVESRLKYWQAKAEKGDRVAQRYIGWHYYLGQGVTKDFVEAATWFRKAADQGDSSAQWLLGICYARGEGL